MSERTADDLRENAHHAYDRISAVEEDVAALTERLTETDRLLAITREDYVSLVHREERRLAGLPARPTESVCRCGHNHNMHSDWVNGCWFAGCACLTFVPKDKP